MESLSRTFPGARLWPAFPFSRDRTLMYPNLPHRYACNSTQPACPIRMQAYPNLPHRHGDKSACTRGKKRRSQEAGAVCCCNSSSVRSRPCCGLVGAGWLWAGGRACGRRAGLALALTGSGLAGSLAGQKRAGLLVGIVCDAI